MKAHDTARAVFRAPAQARTWREVCYAIVGSVLAVPTFVLAIVGVVACVLSVLAVGLPVLLAVLCLARRTPRYFRPPARRLLGRSWAAPPPLRGAGPWRKAGALLQDGAAWRSLAYCLLALPIRVLAGYPGAVVLVVVPAALTLPLSWLLIPSMTDLTGISTWAGTLWIAAQGAAVLFAFPWLLRAVVALDARLAVALLTPDPAQVRIAELQTSRTALRADAAALLRRVERDLHDGPQARLVALGLALARLEKHADPASRSGLAAARGMLTETLAELRDVVRGIHPPALDAGLSLALETLASRSSVPVELSVDLARQPSESTATTLYFSAGELLANVARHAGAHRAALTLREDGAWLLLAVCDDGKGGATESVTGSGLAGLAGRAAALDGSLMIDSPIGGPTIVTMTLPAGV